MRNIIIISILIATINITAQNKARIELNKGIEAYNNGDYEKAQTNFESAFSLNPNYSKAIYNAGNTAYLLGDYEKARNYYSSYIETIEKKEDKAEAYHNIGNSFLNNYKDNKDSESLIESINYYKDALRNNPIDEDTRYNLSYALSQLQKQENKDKDKDKDDKGDKDKDDKGNKDKDDKGNKDKDDKGNKDKEKNKKDKSSEEKQGEKEDKKKEEKAKISKMQAIKNLDAINNEEEKVLLKVMKQKGDKKKQKNNTKDW